MVGFDFELLSQLIIDGFNDLTDGINPLFVRLGQLLFLVASGQGDEA